MPIIIVETGAWRVNDDEFVASDVFQRFPRIVRDVAKDLGKRIELSISGADAELDKSMIEKLAELFDAEAARPRGRAPHRDRGRRAA